MSIAKTGGKNPTTKATGSSRKSPAELRLEQAQRAAMLLKQVSDPTRLQVVLMLAEGERHVGDLCEQLSQSQPALGHHLALLRHGGIIAPRRQGKNTFYGLTEKGAELAAVVRDSIGTAPAAQSQSLAAWEEEIGTLMNDPRAWLNSPNPQFRGKRPIDLIGTDEERVLRIVIDAAKQGAFS